MQFVFKLLECVISSNKVEQTNLIHFVLRNMESALNSLFDLIYRLISILNNKASKYLMRTVLCSCIHYKLFSFNKYVELHCN